jgi:hypothetical protein
MRPNKLSTLLHRKFNRANRGQSFVELVLFMPILIIMLASMTEVVVIFNDYLQMLDGVRAGARFISDSDPYPDDLTPPGGYDTIPYCDAADSLAAGDDGTTTLNFYRLASCVTEDGLAPITLTNGTQNRTINGTGQCVSPSPAQDDIVISAFGVLVTDGDGDETTVDDRVVTVKRFDNNAVSGGAGILIEDNASSAAGADSGWSFMADQHGGVTDPDDGVGGMCSKFTTAQVQSLLLKEAPNTGVVLVEVFYNHYQLFNLPLFGDAIPNPVLLHAYAFFPLVAAEPTPVPSS